MICSTWSICLKCRSFPRREQFGRLRLLAGTRFLHQAGQSCKFRNDLDGDEEDDEDEEDDDDDDDDDDDNVDDVDE